MGCAEGIVWPSLPAEADLGLDRRLKSTRVEEAPEPSVQRMLHVEKGEAEDARRCAEGARRRSRSRSHSLTRIMREIDESKPEEDPVDGDDEAAGMVETYRVAVASGQSKEEAVATVEVVFETNEGEIKRVLRSYLRRPAAQKSPEASKACIQILNHYGKAPSVEEPADVRPPPGLGGGKLFVRKSSEGGLVKPLIAKEPGNPLLQGDQLVAQLFRGSEASRLGDGTVRAGALGDEAEMGARMVHVLEGIRKATEGDKKGTPGSRSAIGAEEALDVYLARGCNTLRVEVIPGCRWKGAIRWSEEGMRALQGVDAEYRMALPDHQCSCLWVGRNGPWREGPFEYGTMVPGRGPRSNGYAQRFRQLRHAQGRQDRTQAATPDPLCHLVEAGPE